MAPAPPRYQPFYCEENVWWLLQDAERFGERPRWAVFISNGQRRCPLWQQRAAEPGEVVVWDYHVIAVARDRRGELEVWDLDSRLAAPVALERYLAATFAAALELGSELAPRFRVVPADVLLERFHSDRSHMRRPDGSFSQPPPAWDPPTLQGLGSNLMRFVDMTDEVAGCVVGLDQLPAAFG